MCDGVLGQILIVQNTGFLNDAEEVYRVGSYVLVQQGNSFSLLALCAQEMCFDEFALSALSAQCDGFIDSFQGIFDLALFPIHFCEVKIGRRLETRIPG